MKGGEDYRESLVTGIANSEQADVKIFIGEHELPVHSLVLVSQSKYFSRALKKAYTEGKTKTITFSEGSKHAYWRAFEFMYTGKYSDSPAKSINAEDDKELTKDVRVYALADYFDIEDLKDCAAKKLEAKLRVKSNWTSDGFIDCISEVYDFTLDDDRQLRDLVTRTACSGISTLWDKKPFRELVRDCGDFAVDFIERLMGRY